METFPAFFPLKDRRVVIAGEGPPAEIKARLFADSPAQVIRLDQTAALEPSSYGGAALIFVASFDPVFAAAAAAAARVEGAPINVVDHPELSDFHTPAIVDRGFIVAAIGSAGAAPLMASLLRAELEMRVPIGAGKLAALLGSRRAPLREAFPDLAQRRAFLRAILAGPVGRDAQVDFEGAGRRLDAAIEAGWRSLGRVSLIERPFEADLISLRAVRSLNVADVVAAPPGDVIIEHHARRDAERLSPADATLDVVSSLAAAGRLVAIVADAFPVPWEADLVARGVAVERLRALPAP